MKTAREILILIVMMVLCRGAAGTGIAAGGNGNGRGGGGGAKPGYGAGSCIASGILTAPEETISGTVSEVGYYGTGISIDTATEIVQVFGIGPIRYWEQVLGVARPDVGDTISVTAREVTFSDGNTKLIAFSITFTASETESEETIILRDSETGLPLWRRAGFRWQYRYLEQ